jgi:YebC/PmpR family DNA-binding regulatory protein
MSGHSHWATIKHKKGAVDAKRGKTFTKMIREITVAAREGGGDLNGNAKLRLVVDKARAANMPKDTIERAIDKGTGKLAGGENYEAATYEGYGPYGTAVMIEVLSDNKNRTVSNLRHLFTKMNGTMAENGAVSWMFENKGVIRATGNLSEDDLIEKLLDYDVDDVTLDEGIFSIECKKQNLDSIKKAIEGLGLKVESAQLEWVPKTPVTVEDKSHEETVIKFLESIEDLDDVQNVYANMG